MKNRRRSALFFGFIIICFVPIVVYQRKISLILYYTSSTANERYDGDNGVIDEPVTTITTTNNNSSSSSSSSSRNSETPPAHKCVGNERDDDGAGKHKEKRVKQRRREYDLPPFESIFQTLKSNNKKDDNTNGSTHNNVTKSRPARTSSRSSHYFHSDVGVRKFISPKIDVSDTLQYAIIGFPKAGTTAMRKALSYISLITGGDYCPSRPEEIIHDMYFLRRPGSSNVWKRAIEKSYVSSKIPKLAQILNEANETGKEGYHGNITATITAAVDDDVDGTNDNAQIVLRGIKCPRGLDTLSMLRYYTTNFPTTKLLVGIRHPVTWFESFYNFRVQNFGKRENPYDLTQSCVPTTPPKDDDLAVTTNATTKSIKRPTTSSYYYYRSITGNARKCRSQSCPNDQLLCVDRARFHLFLSQLGKVPYDDDWDFATTSNGDDDSSNNTYNATLKEFHNVLPSNRYMYETFHSTNPVFLYTMEQMSTSFTFATINETYSTTKEDDVEVTTRQRRVDQFWKDISNFVNDDYDNYNGEDDDDDDDGCDDEDNTNSGQSATTTNKATYYKFMIPTQNNEGNDGDGDDQNDNNNDSKNITTSTFHVKPGKKLSDQQQKERDKYKIDICESKYDQLRIQLMKYSWQMSHYICDYFIPYGGRDHQVHISNREYLCNTILLKYYQHDPCGRLTLVDDKGTYAVA